MILGKGVDKIACIAVNRPRRAGDGRIEQAQKAGDKETQMLADGNAEITKAMGLEFDGRRSSVSAPVRSATPRSSRTA